MDGFGEVITGRPFAAPATLPAVRPRHEPEVLLTAARQPTPRPRRLSRGLAAGIVASAGVHAVLLGALLQTQVGRVEPAPPPPVFLELPPPIPLPMPAPKAEVQPAETQARPVEARPQQSPTAEQPGPQPMVRAPAASPIQRPVQAVPAPVPSAVEPPAPFPAAVRRAQASAPAAPVSAAEPAPPVAPPPPSAAASHAGYEGRVMAKLAKAKRYPASARARREEGTAQVRFTVSRQGRVSGVSVARSSGSTSLDREAMDTVRRAQPLPPVPEGLAAPMQMTLGVAFNLR